MDEFAKRPPVSETAAAVARAANLSALLQSMALGALPTEVIEGLLVASEIAIVVRKAVGVLDDTEAEALKARIAEWGREVVERMEADGTAEALRKEHEAKLEEARKAKDGGEGGMPN